MKDKCTKFEGMFVFSSNEDFKAHLEECEECREKQKELDKISNLIQKARPFYFKEKRKKQTHFKIACSLLLFVMAGSVFSVLNYDNALVDTMKYGQTLSAEDFGFPVDSYGLILVDEWTLKKYSILTSKMLNTL